jgi:tetratricopeptide (TPR) repeat protein
VVPAGAAEDPLQRGIRALESGAAAEAREVFRRLVEADGENAVSRLWLGRALLAESRLDEAVEQLGRAVELSPGRAEVHLWLGRAWLAKLQQADGVAQGRYALRVRSAFEKAVELDPDDVQARVSLAHYYANAPFIAGGSWKKARAQAAAVVDRQPLAGYLLLAGIEQQAEDWPAAEAALRRAIELDPRDAGSRFALGMVYQAMERWTAARAAFEAAVGIDPEHGLAWYQIGRTGALSGEDLDRALESIDRFLERHVDAAPAPYHAGAWWRRGMILEQRGDEVRAAESYRRALEIRPDDEEIRAALAALGR